MKISTFFQNLFSSEEEIHDADTPWILKFSQNGIEGTRIIYGETKSIIRERFLSINYNARIKDIICLKKDVKDDK